MNTKKLEQLACKYTNINTELPTELIYYTSKRGI